MNRSMPATPTAPAAGVSAAYIAGLIGRARLEQILNRLGRVDGRPKARDVIDYVTAWKVLNANVETMADEGHRLSNAAVPTGNFELLIASMVQGQSLADGLTRMAAGAKILRPDLAFQVVTRAGRARLTIRFASGETFAQAIYLEALTTVIHCAVRWGIGDDAQPVRVRGPALIDPGHGSWLRLFGAPVQRHGEGVTVVYSSAVSAAPFCQHGFSRWHDATFKEYLRLVTQLETRESRQQTQTARRVRDALISGARDQVEVARHLGMSVASLRRRLSEECASFRDIQAQIRREAAQVLLLGDKSVEDIATELGLSDARCFRRACRTWFGQSPSAVRRSLRLSGLSAPKHA